MLSRKEVYDKLYLEMVMKISAKNMTPDGKSLDKCSREANIYAVKHTWCWFNNQEEFLSHCFY